MTPPARSVVYCTQTDVERILSVTGVRDRLDDDQDGYVSTAEQARMTEICEDVSDTVDFYCWDRYSPDQLSLSSWVLKRSAELAAYFLCTTRANPVPQSIMDRAQKAEDWLEQVHEGRYRIPSCVLRRSQAPVWSSIRADPRYNWRVLRVELGYSSSRQTTTQPQNPDYREQFSAEM